MHLYWLFLLVATATVCSPGPGVVMTLSNALRYDRLSTLGGILGIATSTLIVAGVSATSLGVLLATSAQAFTILKFLGAGYLIYLGIRLWRAPALVFADAQTRAGGFGRCFRDAFVMQLTNPKAVFFFLSVLPQFMDPGRNYALQFSALVMTYATLVVIVHCGYALCARRAQGWLSSERGGKLVNRMAASMFMAFGGVLATAHR